MSTNSNNKRVAEAHDERLQQPEDSNTTKRQRRTTMMLEEGQKQQRNEKAELRRLEGKIVSGIQSKEEELVEVQRDLARMKPQLKKIRAQIESLKEEPAKAERARRCAANPRIERALHVHMSESIAVDELLKDRFSDLIDNCDFWWAFLDAKDRKPDLDSTVSQIFTRHRPPSVLNNTELILKLCKYDPRIYRAIPDDSHLKLDRQIVGAALASAHMVVDIPAAAQLHNPRLIAESLARLPCWELDINKSLKKKIDITAWRNRDFVLGWLKGGGDLHHGIPQTLREDPEILLPAMSNKIPAQLQNPAVPLRLRGNIEFMRKAVEKNPFMLNQVSETLRGRKDLALAALSGPHGYLTVRFAHHRFVPRGIGNFSSIRNRLWTQVGGYIRQQLHLHDTFVKLVLGSVHLSDTKPSNLSILDHGGESTLAARMTLIAEFAGVPIGKELGKLRRCHEVLARSGMSWSD